MPTLYEKSLELLNKRAPFVNPDDFSFVFIGDSWVGEGYTSEQIFQASLTEANNRNPLFILHGGDAIFRGGNDPDKKFQTFLTLASTYAPNIPMFVVPGNHDSTRQDEPDFTKFESYIGPKRFTVENDRVNLKLVGIDTSWTKPQSTNVYYLSDETLHYLEESLKTGKKNTFVANHVAPFAGKWKYTLDETDSTFRQGASRFLKIIRWKVKRAFVSHVHIFDKAFITFTPFILSGGAGAALVKNHKFHIVVIRVRKGRVSYKFVPVGWSA